MAEPRTLISCRYNKRYLDNNTANWRHPMRAELILAALFSLTHRLAFEHYIGRVDFVSASEPRTIVKFPVSMV